ncbi:bifunctional sulfate adenylyltransferase subunit 1/adenylylsulfate kinase [Pseudenhygromyxa sp. WMMC2535]|uniref:bifunctional sulfate adenylyltransferase subunit 1/adenylylsulfate kinase n=1 Tax=Pseudenhygromyxa sp. WMMC2535 TaxID=2712867 RepID=UPI0015521914|nr:bifunctional sulfate adenylyltransferase subunit 1/adenylylsulfate kinase [Pseudenhygromyxa sp. WMMC2535]NVB39806.1 bifunctional sulfate adenylyltransferase subunit 1/adenylylsulfate kinase [Pseudenhygromyxa sp. WMMC2535]
MAVEHRSYPFPAKPPAAEDRPVSSLIETIPAPDSSDQETLEFLADYESRTLLRFVTIGSVDDGKSTLIGRLLYETGGVFEDQLAAVTSGEGEGEEVINFANLTDGLVAEREQGITIDVAYRYFATKHRKFIIADTPGHVQYTRNMATGASTADAAIILIDARLGVLQQSRRHAYIANLLGIPHLLVAVNKMDLVDFDQGTYEAIVAEFRAFTGQLAFAKVEFFPVSALLGDNVVAASDKTPWFAAAGGKPILEHLETIELASAGDEDRPIFPVQLVSRPNLDFRGYAGTMAAGSLRPGDAIKVLPSGKTSKIERLVTWDGDLPEAFAPMSVTLTLADEIDISRGDVITRVDNDLHVSRRLQATLVWMHDIPLEPGRQYLIKHMTNLVSGTVVAVDHRVDMDTLERVPTQTLALNEIGDVTLSLNRPLILDDYVRDKTAGSFVIIDRVSNVTIAAGMIRGHGEDYQDDGRAVAAALSAEERAARFRQKPAVLWMTGRAGTGKIVVARSLERRLFDAGHQAYVFDPRRISRVERQAQGKALDFLIDAAELAADSGMLVIVAFTSPARSDRDRARERLGERFEFIEAFFDAELPTCRSRLEALGRDPEEASYAYEPPDDPDVMVDGDELDIEREVDRLMRALERRGIIETI